MKSFKNDYLKKLGKTGTLHRPEFTNTGIVHMYSGDTAPAGYLLCDGTVYSTIALPYLDNLYTIIGNQFGGTDHTNFQVPDLRGMVLKGTGANNKIFTAEGFPYDGGNIGDYQQDSFHSHNHNDSIQLALGTDAGYTAPQTQLFAAGAAPFTYPGLIWIQEGQPIKSGKVGYPTSRSGFGTIRDGNETKPATISLNYIIKW